MKSQADNLVYLANLQSGDELPDGEVTMEVKSGSKKWLSHKNNETAISINLSG